MKLTKEDKELLKSWGYLDEDMDQIGKAATKTIYELDNEKISMKKAIEVLGRKEFLSGLSRSAFHYSALRENEKGQEVYFNSHKFFKE